VVRFRLDDVMNN